MFSIENSPLDTQGLREAVLDPACGAVSSFEGLVRNHHRNRAVSRLEYEAHPLLAPAEGTRVVREALDRFDIAHAIAAHRIGILEIGEVSVAVFVSAAHRAPAFEACRYIIDTLKREVPIWKREHFADGSVEWVGACEGCMDAR